MDFERVFLSVIFLFACWVKFCNSTTVVSSTLDNQHVTVAAVEVPNGMEVTRNSSGHIIKFDGADWKVIQWLSAAHINTTFGIIIINPLRNPLDKSGEKLGAFDLVGKGEYDMMTNSVPTPSRATIVDFSHPIVYAAVSYLIPSSYQSNNIFSVSKPFQTWVWVSLLMAILVVYAIFFLIEVIGKKNKWRMHLEIVSYVIGILLYQASTYRLSKMLAIRVVIAAWSIGALLLINYYNSLCISFFTISIKKPLIQSIQELPTRPDIRLVTDRNRHTATSLLSAEFGLLKGLGDKLRADPGSLCNLPSRCVDLVKQGKAVYTNGRQAMLAKVFKEDFEATGKCNMEMGKENYMELQISWALQKKSPYMDPLNKSFMRLLETGLFGKWSEERLPKVECMSTTKMKKDQTAEGREPLPLKGFAGTFIILFVGIGVSLIFFILEIFIITRIIVI